MVVTTLDTAKFDKAIGVLENIWKHRKANPIEKSDELYYRLVLQYMQRIQAARDEGKFIVGHTIVIPPEIFYAMDIVPMHLEATSMLITQCLNAYDEAFNAAKGYGFAPEVCSAHRNLNALCVLGWLPRPDAVIWSNQVCDNTSKSGDAPVEIYGVPGFFLDRPYNYTDRDAFYYAKELEDMIHFLEEVSQRKMDWDRLEEALIHSKRAVDLHREIGQLRKSIPSPMRNRKFMFLLVLEWYFSGTPECVDFYQTIYDEIKERADKGEGFIPEEKYRLLTLFLPPINMWKLLDWMEREFGAVSVAEPYCSDWGEGDIDPSKPLESLARKSFYRPICRPMHGPLREGLLSDTLRDAMEYKVDAAIYWAHIGCRQACACIRILKDELSEKCGVPTLVLDNDLIDPTFATEEELKDKLEGFFERLEDLK
jgi:benzoyl-CoA reductase/2-hydroxyglutaryl-CoA dehydratase subunit BcrC/BadD/HgdB